MSIEQQLPGERNNTLSAAAKTVPWLILVLLAGAVVYYKQRMLFIDAPHVFFRVVNDGQMHIEENRYGSFITQMVPLIGARLHLPFRLLLILYSVSFYVFFLAVALLLVYTFRNFGLAILFGLYLTLFVSDTYYWPNNEVHQGITWLMFALGLSLFAAERRWPLLLSVPLFAASFYLAIWTHPLVMLVAVYLWFFFLMDGHFRFFSLVQSVGFTLVLLLLSWLKYSQGSHGGYDSTKIEVITAFHVNRIAEVFSSPQWKFFVDGCVHNYWLFVLLFVAGIVGLLWQRKYLQALWTLLVAAGYVILVCITFWNLNTGRFYIEGEYMPLSVICCAPFVFYVLPKLNSKTAVLLIVLIFCVRLGYIYYAAKPFTNRVAIMDGMLNKMREKGLIKVIIPEPVAGIDSALVMNWGAPVESIFLSKLKGDQPQRTFIFAQPDFLPQIASMGKDTLAGCWERRTVNSINTRYFMFDTTSHYTVMSYDALMK